MDDQILTFVLLAAGLSLLVIELMVPSGGIIGIFSIASFLGSAWFAHKAWADSNPLYWKIYVITFLIMIPVTLFGIYYLLTKTAFGNRVLLSAPSREEVTPYQEQYKQMEELIGQTGKAISPLCPGGLVEINNERLHAIGDGFIVEKGSPVKVVEIRGTRVVVIPFTEPGTSEPKIPAEENNSIAASEASTTDSRPSPSKDNIVDPFLEADQS